MASSWKSHPKLKPMDAPTDGVFYAGACQGLKDIPYSVSQGSGAASRAATVISKPKWKIEPIISIVDETKCRNKTAKCGVCVDKCPYGAIRARKAKASQHNHCQAAMAAEHALPNAPNMQ